MSTAEQFLTAGYAIALFGLLAWVVALGLRTARTARRAETLAGAIAPDTPARPAPAPVAADPVAPTPGGRT